MMKRYYLTAAERRTLADMHEHGPALRIYTSWRADDYSWWIAGRPVTRTVHSLALKRRVLIAGNEAKPV